MQSSTCAFGNYCDVISISHTIHWHLFSNSSPIRSPVKEKEINEGWKNHHGTVENTARDKKPYEYWKSSAAHASDYIVLRANPGLTSCASHKQ